MPPAASLSGLSPWAARLCLKIEAFLRPRLPDAAAGGTLLAAFSGGPDSTALLLVLRLLAPRLNVRLTAAHLDHGLRPESGAQAAACADFCRELGLPCRMGFADVGALARSQGLGIEEAGRLARYAFLEESRIEAGACAVALAHQLNELAQDVLMRLIRGTGWPALAGMTAWDPGRHIVRPLLLVPKADLLRFLKEQDVPWLEDASNADPAFLRNRVRQDILPLLVRENPAFLNAVAELWLQGETDGAYFDQVVSEFLPDAAETESVRRLPDAVLRAVHPALRLRLYKRAVESLGPGQPLATALRALDRAWADRRLGRTIQFPGGKQARVERGGIAFVPCETSNAVDRQESGE